MDNKTAFVQLRLTCTNVENSANRTDYITVGQRIVQELLSIFFISTVPKISSPQTLYIMRRTLTDTFLRKGRNEVRGARSKFGAPMFELEVIRKHMYCIEESTSYIVGTFRSVGAPIVIRRPVNCAPLHPITPLFYEV